MCALSHSSCQALPALTMPARGADRELLLDSGFLLYVVSYVCTALGLAFDLLGARYQGPCTREAAAGHLPALAKAMVGLCEGRPVPEAHHMACVPLVLAPLLAHTVGRGGGAQRVMQGRAGWRSREVGLCFEKASQSVKREGGAVGASEVLFLLILLWTV